MEALTRQIDRRRERSIPEAADFPVVVANSP